MLSTAPLTMSPNIPPMPKPCAAAHSPRAGSDDAQIDSAASQIGRKITRPAARSSPWCRMNRPPHTQAAAPAPSAAQPMIMSASAAPSAPASPSRLRTSPPEAESQLGSSGW